MNIEEIIYSNNNEYYNIYSLVIKKYLLNVLINKKKSLESYEDCINYFYKINDINFKDSLEDINIANILYNSLCNIKVYEQFHKNKIIISDSLDLFYESSAINYSLENINLNFKFDFNFKYTKNTIDIISKIDDIYKELTGQDNCIFNKIYKKYNFQNKKKKIEINKRIKEISIIIKNIYKLVLNDSIDINNFNREMFINSLRIISIIKLKIKDDVKINDKLVIFSPLDTKDTQDTKDNQDTQDTQNTQNTQKNILNIIKLHDLIYKEYCNENEDIIEFIERILNEYDSLNEILNLIISDTKMDDLFNNFVKEINTFIELNENILEDEINILKEFIKLTGEIINKFDFNEYENIIYYENIFKIQLFNFKKSQTEHSNNNLLKLNDELNKMSESKNILELQKILEEVQKEVNKNNELINVYNFEIDIIKHSHTSEENDFLDEDIINVNKNIDDLLYYFNEDKVIRIDIIELFNKCGFQYNYNKFNNIIDIFSEKKIFMNFIETVKINKKDINKKYINLFLKLFNYNSPETYDLYTNRIKNTELTFYNNKFTLNKYEIDLVMNKIGFFIRDLIEK